MNKEAYVTMVLTDDYAQGALVLGHRLANVDNTRDRVVLVTPNLTPNTRSKLEATFTSVVVVNPIEAAASHELTLLDRPELQSATTKLHVWTLPYRQVVYLDADTLPLGGPGSLEALFEPLASGTGIRAAPDVGWPDIFNSGVFSIYPAKQTFDELLVELAKGKSFDGSDQGLLNEYFAGKWDRLPFLYNVTFSASYQYAPAFARFRQAVRVVHFIGPNKPWKVSTGGALLEGPAAAMLQLWKEAELDARLAGLHLPDTTLPAEAESSTIPYDPAKVIEAPVDHWNAAVHAPLTGTRPEASVLNTDLENETNANAEDDLDEDTFEFPTYGPTTVKLPFEYDHEPPERVF